jgi:hypothetical protein
MRSPFGAGPLARPSRAVRLSPAMFTSADIDGRSVFSRMSLRSVSQPGDAAEREADAMADRALFNTLSSTADAAVGMQRRATSGNRGGTTVNGSTAASWLAGGRPLDHATRDYFEPRFGADLDHVRVHDCPEAHRAAAGIGAQAFSIGQNIAFADGQYAPGTKSGRGLIAHELAHTIQQSRESAPAGIFRKPIPGWNFTPADFAELQLAGGALTIAPDSGFLPAKLQENLLNTLAYVLGPTISPRATEGVNALDFFHGHLVVKKDPATAGQAQSAAKNEASLQKELTRARTKALGGPVQYPNYPLTPKNIGAYQKAIEKLLPSFGSLLDEASKVPGAAMMYHTFEFNQPSEWRVIALFPDDPRRHYVTPLDTNQPRQYRPPPGGYETEYTHITRFVFLVDSKGAVHVRPLVTTGGFTTLELSTITGTMFPEPLENEIFPVGDFPVPGVERPVPTTLPG